ncbi:MAG: ATP-dependent Clp protease ATP-binding subunit [Lentimicrobium sp.]|nr:ATP-dependent Clp protease ATP-binding subunit [Lentimicrobium sp.]
MEKISLGIQVAWEIAAKEAVYSGYNEIEPEHFLLGILKLTDIANKLNKVYPSLSEEIAAEIKKEAEPIQQVFNVLKYDITGLRRSFRELLKKESSNEKDEVLHRSKASKDLFEQLFSGKYSNNPPNMLHFILLLLESNNKKISLHADKLKITNNDLLEKLKGKLKNTNTNSLNSLLISQVGRNLSILASEGKLKPVIGREKEIRDLARVLLQKEKKNALIIGEAGVGKTAVVEGLALAILSGNVPEILKSKIIIEISMSNIVAGTKYRGEFEGKVKKIIDELKQHNEIVLFIDEIHTVVGAGSTGGAEDASNMLKPAMARGEIQLIGATTIKEYRKYIEKDSAFERRFQILKIDEPDQATAIKIISGIKHNFEQHYGITITDKAIEKAVELSIRYLPEKKLPDKAIDVIEKACSYKLFPTVLNVNYNSIVNINSGSAFELNETDILKAVSKICNFPLENLTKDERQKFLGMEDFLSKWVIGQDEAVSDICETIRIAKSGLKAPGKPIGVFLFIGPTGVGKTEMAKVLTEFLFNDKRKLIRFDMSEYMEKHQISKLIGAPPGYVGYEEEGQLIQQVRNHPYSVILFDEIEKAHPDIYPIFLQIFDEGILTGSQGKSASFTESVIILTSNLGSNISKENNHKEVGYKRVNIEEELAEDKKIYRNKIISAVKDHFAPELVNRIQKISVFYYLAKSDIEIIIDKLIDNLNERLFEKNIQIKLDHEARGFLIDKGYNRENGVRYLERTIDKEIITPLGKLILEKKLENLLLKIVKKGDKLDFEKDIESL